MSSVFIDHIIGTVILRDDEIDAIIVNEDNPIDVHHIISNGRCYNVVDGSFKTHSDLESFQTSMRGHKVNWDNVHKFFGYKFANIDMVVCNVNIDTQVDSHLFNGEIALVVFDSTTYEKISRDKVEQILNDNIFTPRTMRNIKNKTDIKKIKSHTKHGLNLRLAIPVNEFNPNREFGNLHHSSAEINKNPQQSGVEINGTVFY